MAKTLQHRRGTTTELASVTGAIGEIFMDTTKNTLVVMDGTTPGGVPLAKSSELGSGGSSYDQSLNTTDDVVFNSALVGDVSIISNTISGLDSYGNADTLIVDGNLNVDFTSTTGAVNQLSISAIYYQYDYYNPSNAFFQLNQSALSNWQEIKDELFTVSPGTVILFTAYDSSFGATRNFRLTVNSFGPLLVDYYGLEYKDVVGSIEYDNGGNWVTYSGGSLSSLDMTIDNTAVVTDTVLAVTTAGVNVTGALTVNGTVVGAAPTAFGVGSYAMLQLSAGNGDIAAGQTVVSTEGFAAGPLFPAGVADVSGTLDNLSQALGVAGTWMCMGYAPSNAGPVITLWYRIS